MADDTTKYASDEHPLVFLDHVYFGTGGFQDGSYLVQYPRESSDKYTRRRVLATYVNYFRPIVDSHTKPIFRRKIVRTDSGENAAWTEFVADATQGGQSIQGFMRDQAIAAKRSGCALIVVSAPQDAPRSAAEEIESRPFVYGVKASQITYLRRDLLGRVEAVEFTEGYEVAADEWESWTRRIDAKGWELRDEKGGVQNSGEWDRPRADAPVVLLAPGDWLDQAVSKQVTPRSEFFSIASACTDLFNLRSEGREIIRGLTFPILTYPAMKLDGLKIGTNNALGYDPATTHEPAFIAPPDGPVEQIRKEREDLVREIYRMALLSHQAGTGDSTATEAAKSGVAMRIDKEDYDTALADWASILEGAENRIREIFGWYQGEGVVIDASVSYPRDFTMRDALVELQPLIEAVAGLPDMPPTMKARIYTRAADVMLGEDPELETVRDEIQQRLVDETQTGGSDGRTPGDRTSVPGDDGAA
jgi:hypothetical protein